MSEWRSGYHGEDSMRDKAERMFREEGRELDRVVPGSYSARSRENTRFYAKGGHVKGREMYHEMEASQHDMKIPRVAKTPKLSVQNFQEAARMRKGGKVRHRADGGAMADGGQMSDGGAMSAYHRGGRSKQHHYADGGAVPSLPPQMQEMMMKAAQDNQSDRMPVAACGPRFPRPTGTGPFGMPQPMKKGGRARHKADGGLMGNAYQSNMANNALNSMATNALNSASSAMKRGGKAHHKHHKADGGMMDAIKADAMRRQAEAAKGIPQIAVYNPGRPGMKKGGKAHHRADGGKMADGGSMSAMRKGGHAHKKHHKDCYAGGGAVTNHYARYEADMMGEHRGAPNHYRDYEADMMGEHGGHMASDHPHIGRSKGTPFAAGGYAMGGIGKIRHKQATKSGQQIGHTGAKGSPFA